MTNTTDPYPELEKLRQVSDESRAISGFLEWAESKGYRLVKTVTTEVVDWRGSTTTEEDEVPANVDQALADYFGIDMDKVEAERRELLDRLRRAQAEAEAAGA